MYVREITHSLKDRSLTAYQSLVATPYVMTQPSQFEMMLCNAKMLRDSNSGQRDWRVATSTNHVTYLNSMCDMYV